MSINDKNHIPVYLDQECDVDMKEVMKAGEGKTIEELDAEWEEFKRNFMKEHPEDFDGSNDNTEE